jgi:hypothetical protein
MDLILEFHDGLISGEGADGIGFFGIDGRYHSKAAECSWIKTYFGSHSVEYSGFRERKGIWGTWTIGASKGGFHIWPIGEDAAIKALKEEVEQEFPVLVALKTGANHASQQLTSSVPFAPKCKPARSQARLEGTARRAQAR